MIVVSDASPLIALDSVGRLHLLREVFGRVLVPEAVRREVEHGPKVSLRLNTLSWIEIRSAGDASLIAELSASNLDDGEAAAIALALEVSADYLLVDERVARRVAKQHGLEVVGVLGVLLAAKRLGALASIRPAIEALIHDAGFRASSRLVADVLRAAGESPDA